MEKVNFFLIGAAKCGTTALYERMKHHPEIYLSPLKEPNYWSTDIDIAQFSAAFKANTPLDLSAYLLQEPLPEKPVGFLRNEGHYARLFDAVQNEKMVGECSTSYLYSEVAAERIAKAHPDAKILVVLRDPVERLFSHYLMARKYGFVTEDLKVAVDRDFSRENKGWGRSELFVELGLYGKQLERWYEHFGRSQIKVLFTPQLNEEDTYSELYEWLGVGENRAAGTKIKNEEKTNSAGLARFEGLNKWLTDSGLKKALGAIVPLNFKRKLLNLYYTDVNLPTLSEADRKYLSGFYAKDKERLEAVLQRPVPWN
ncbi:MAG: sulfotransferase [Flavobacteriales bacterium]|nr:sulfotransferase [Flavobacteriales bacterium]